MSPALGASQFLASPLTEHWGGGDWTHSEPTWPSVVAPEDMRSLWGQLRAVGGEQEGVRVAAQKFYVTVSS